MLFWMRSTLLCCGLHGCENVHHHKVVRLSKHNKSGKILISGLFYVSFIFHYIFIFQSLKSHNYCRLTHISSRQDFDHYYYHHHHCHPPPPPHHHHHHHRHHHHHSHHQIENFKTDLESYFLQQMSLTT